MDRDEIVDSRASWSDVFLLKEFKMAFFKKDVKIGIRRSPDRMHLQVPPLLSNDRGEVQRTLLCISLFFYYRLVQLSIEGSYCFFLLPLFFSTR